MTQMESTTALNVIKEAEIQQLRAELRQKDLLITQHQKALFDAQHAKTQLINNLSYNLRTPITGIIGLSQLLHEQLPNSQEKQHAQSIHESGQQLLSFFNQVLDIIALDYCNDTDINNVPCDVREELINICRLQMPSIQLKNLNFNVHIDPNITQFVLYDRLKIQRIMLNLLGNAIKFTPKGNVSISVYQRATMQNHMQLEFIIADSGIGIEAHLQSHIFEPFFRGIPAHKGTYEGHGIGLYPVKKLAELMGGSLTFTSTPQQGSAFSFTLWVAALEDKLPLNECFNLADIAPDMPPLAPSAQPRTAQPIKTRAAPFIPHILLVEDNPVAMQLVAALTKQSGCRITSAMDGEQGLALALEHDYDLIIIDYGLPGMCGNELAQRIRADEQHRQRKATPIIGLTAQSFDEAQARGLAAGMNQIYEKPLKLHTLRTLLNQYVQQPDVPQPVAHDLPEVEAQLFDLSSLPILDSETGISHLGSLKFLKKLLTLLVTDVLPAEQDRLTQAYALADWAALEHHAHKLKSSALYCGTLKLQYACQYLERYYKTGQQALLAQLYEQLITVMAETQIAVSAWLQE